LQLIVPVVSSKFQSTPAHGGRLGKDVIDVFNEMVSIHARTRRATFNTAAKQAGCLVSIHARTRRATSSPFVLVLLSSFQSTPAHGGRRAACSAAACKSAFQSTPAHGGRHCRPLKMLGSSKFQSTPAHGGRHDTSKVSVPGMQFQSTPAHGGRRFQRRPVPAAFGFNPRPHTAGDSFIES